MSGQGQETNQETAGGRGARKRILEAAERLFYRDGINATGVERLASEASVSKRTLYQHFPSKTAVVEAYLHGMLEMAGDPINPTATDLGRPPRSRLLAIFDRSLPDGQLRGCPFHNAAVEAAEAMPEVAEIVHKLKQDYTDSLIDLAKQADAADPRLLGQQLAVLYEGAAALGTSLDDPAPWEHARTAAEILVDNALSQ